MKLLDEVFHNVREAVNRAVLRDDQWRTNPLMAIYVSPEFYQQMLAEMARYGKVTQHEHEFIYNRTFCGFPVYRVVDANPENPHPPCSVLHVGWES